MTPSRVDRYWQQFLESLPPDGRLPTYYEAYYFGSKQYAEEISALVKEGTKTASGTLKWVYDVDPGAFTAGATDTPTKPPPKPGYLSIVTNGSDEPVCIIETTEVRTVPFDEVDEQFAHDGGEGDKTLRSWREMYWSYIVAECARINREPTQVTPLVCERFRVVYKDPLK